MALIVSAVSPSLDSEVDPRFGRCQWFLVVDPETLEHKAHQNPAVNASGGAGTLAAQFVAAQNADAVISGNYGPNAFQALRAAGVPMYLFGPGGTARQAVERFKAGQLEQASAPTSHGHSGRPSPG